MPLALSSTVTKLGHDLPRGLRAPRRVDRQVAGSW
jgi:hypothetical protein